MSRIYKSHFNSVSIAAAQDIFSLLTPASRVAIIHEVRLSQRDEVQDAEEVMILLRMRSGQTAAGSGGAAPAVIPRMLGDSASLCTVRINDTTIASGGTIVQPWSEYWNVRIPFVQIWTPETRPVLPPSSRWTFELVGTPAKTLVCSGHLIFETIG